MLDLRFVQTELRLDQIIVELALDDWRIEHRLILRTGVRRLSAFHVLRRRTVLRTARRR